MSGQREKVDHRSSYTSCLPSVFVHIDCIECDDERRRNNGLFLLLPTDRPWGTMSVAAQVYVPWDRSSSKDCQVPTFVRKQDKQSHSSTIRDEPLWVLLPIVQMIEHSSKCEQSDGLCSFHLSEVRRFTKQSVLASAVCANVRYFYTSGR